MSHVIFNPRTFASNLLHNLEYFFVGRHAGHAAVFLPGLLRDARAAGIAWSTEPRAAGGRWQWLVLASALAQGLIFVIVTPYTWRAAASGNRYFISGYGVMLFLLPAIESLGRRLCRGRSAELFVAPMVLNPFAAAAKPADIATHGPLRLLPVELTLLNDLPVMTEGDDRARVWFGELGAGRSRVPRHFLDDNAFGREPDRSSGRAAIPAPRSSSRPTSRFAGLSSPSLRVPCRRTCASTCRAADNRFTWTPGRPSRSRRVMPPGLPYEKEVTGVQLWKISIVTKGGFTPIFFDAASSDARYLGVRVRPMLEVKTP